MVGLVVGIAFVAAIGLFVFVLFHPRPTMDHLYDVPDDLRRADDNQQPPFDGSAGWMPPPT